MATEEKPDDLINAHETACTLGVSRPTLAKMIDEGRFPQPTMLTPTLRRWRRGDVQDWLMKRIAERDAIAQGLVPKPVPPAVAAAINEAVRAALSAAGITPQKPAPQPKPWDETSIQK